MFERFKWSRTIVVKKICKFLLKKKLGEVILGDIDLDQLDVQLKSGTIQLSDLALDVDFLNRKLAGAPVVVKEGSIKSLTIKIPWKLRNCEIEVSELELVLGSFTDIDVPVTDVDGSPKSHKDEHLACQNVDKSELNSIHDYHGGIPPDVHEGVKTIAKIVKWFLTSFHVRINRIIVAFDPPKDFDERALMPHKSLVLRMKEIEFGTRVCEDSTAKLMNFVKFKEANVEFLEMNDICLDPSTTGISSMNYNLGHKTTSILTGANFGFSGMVNLSIPWKNGLLDTRKVDAEVSIDPIEIRVQPSSIEWFIATWQLLKSMGTSEGMNNGRTADSFLSSSRSCYNRPSMQSSTLLGRYTDIPEEGSESNSQQFATQEKAPDGLLKGTHVIHNWVPESIYQEDQLDLVDYGASVDQFFECFDELRSSQANLGSSGIWNWTCSVFNAITVASNLASGSGDIPKEQLVETSLRAAIAGISVHLFVNNEEQLVQGSKSLVEPLLDGQKSECYMSCFSSSNIENFRITEAHLENQRIHHLEVRCQNMILDLQTYPQNTKISMVLKHIEVDEFYDAESCCKRFPQEDHENCAKRMLSSRHSLQKQLQKVLPPCPFPGECHDPESGATINTPKGLIRVRVLDSFGGLNCQCDINSKDSNGRPVASTLFSVHLPPFMFWAHLNLVNMLNMLLDLFRLVDISFTKMNTRKNLTSDFLYKSSNSSSHDAAEIGLSTNGSNTTPGSCLEGNIVLPQARIILLFPSEYYGGCNNSNSSDKFIVLDHSSPSASTDISDAFELQQLSSASNNHCTTSSSIHLHTSNFDIFFVDTVSTNAEEDTQTSDARLFSAVKILSVIGRKVRPHSDVTMLWQKGPVTGRWMADRAWKLCTLHDRRSKSKVTGKGNEFFSVAAAEDVEETSSIRQELILSSAYLMQIRFSCLRINLDNQYYKMLICLLNNIVDGFSRAANQMEKNTNNSVTSPKTSSSSVLTQSSISVEFDVLDISVTLDELLEVSHLLQRELKGSWKHLKLEAKKFELLSVSNVGGIIDANFLWLNHGEGKLWGSILNKDVKASEEVKDVLLITCQDSVMRRGNGEGANALSFGPAGTAVTHLWNPQLKQSYTSVTVRCGTVIAPGGRLDWISAICLYFNLPTDNSLSDGTQKKDSNSYSDCKTVFYLDLLDVALSYEPHEDQLKTCIREDSELEHSYAVEPNVETSIKSTSCILSAASFSLYNNGKSESGSDYIIHLKDVGLLISESACTRVNLGDYSVSFLQEFGYAKVAQIALLQTHVKITEQWWEIESSDLHVHLGSCHDTTYGLISLIAQLQELYSPDIANAVVHLQSRWNSVKQIHKDPGTSHMDNTFMSAAAGSDCDNFSTSNDTSQTIGLLDEILENAFECKISTDFGDKVHHGSPAQGRFEEKNEEDKRAVNSFTMNVLHSATSCANETLSPLIIESYCAPDVLLSSASSVSIRSPNEANKDIPSTTACRDIEYGRGRWYNDDYFTVVENHITTNSSYTVEKDLQQEVERESAYFDAPVYCLPKGKITLKNMDVRWNMYSGLDWSQPKEVTKVTSNGRDGNACLELTLSGLDLQYDIYPEYETNVSKLCLSIQDFHVCDKSKDAPWKMVLGNCHSKDHPRKSGAKAFKLELESVRPNPLIPLEEYRLCVEFLPLRLHLDQTQLDFLVSFFGKNAFDDQSPFPNDFDESEISMIKNRKFGSQTVAEEALLPFFQKCDVRPIIVRVDYIPRHFDPAALRRGNYAELLNLVAWKGIDLQLKHVGVLGMYGWSSICETIAGAWLEDIAQNQVHKLLKGVAPIRSLFALGSGTSKLVSSPVKSFRKDRKLLKGVQRGALAFLKSISLEAVGLGVHLAAGAHEILLQTEYVLTSNPSSEIKKKRGNVKSNQPEDAQDGIQQAYESLSDGFGRTASALFGSPLKAYQRGAGAGLALATAIRAAPAAAIAPLSASARAVHCTLLGVRNSLDPEHKRESLEKYYGPSQS